MEQTCVTSSARHWWVAGKSIDRMETTGEADWKRKRTESVSGNGGKVSLRNDRWVVGQLLPCRGIGY